MTAPWVDEASRLRTEGLTYTDIAGRLGKDESTIRRAIGVDGRRLYYTRRDCYGTPHTPKATPKPPKREPQKPVPWEVKKLAFDAWLAGTITRDEMLDRAFPRR